MSIQGRTSRVEPSRLVLFVAGRGSVSELSVARARELEIQCGGTIELEVVDIRTDPRRAESAGVLVVPSFVLHRAEGPDLVVAGDLPSVGELAARLGLTADVLADVASEEPAPEGTDDRDDPAALTRVLVSESPDGVVVVDDAAKVVFVNEAAEGLFGRPSTHLLGTVLRLSRADKAPAELEIVHPGGGTTTVELRTAVITWGDHPATLATLRDITARKQAAESVAQLAEELAARNAALRDTVADLERGTVELSRSNETLDSYAADVSHDLKTPLAIIAGAAQTLREYYGESLGDTGAELCASIVRSANRMAGLLDGFLRAARANSELAAIPVDTQQLVHELVATLARPLDDCHGEVASGALPVVTADPVQLGEVFQNLITNAIKYRSPDRPLRVSVSGQRVDDRFVFLVTDNGIGISVADRGRVFGTRVRLEGDRFRAAGEGLGLAICQRIIERHGGRIWVEDSDATGATFAFSLPAAA